MYFVVANGGDIVSMLNGSYQAPWYGRNGTKRENGAGILA
jgi:hypothetical protein